MLGLALLLDLAQALVDDPLDLGGVGRRDDLRHIRDLDCYEYSLVLRGANRYARQVSVKASPATGCEFTSTAGAAAAVDRARLFNPVTCAICGQPAASVATALPSGSRLICTTCMSVLDGLAVAAGVTTADQLAEAAGRGRLRALSRGGRPVTAREPGGSDP